MSRVVDLSEQRRNPWLIWFIGGWTAIVVMLAITLRLQKDWLSVGYVFASKAVEGYSLALLSLVVWWASDRIHRAKLSLAAAAFAHTILGLAVIAIWKAAHIVFYYFTIGPNWWQRVFENSWVFQALLAAAMYTTVLGGTLALQSMRREREREVREARLELAAREAELAAVRAQLHPHFLFNSLNSILQLIDSDPSRAREMVVRLSEVMQASLRRADLDEVPLSEEIDLIRAYLDIEKVRFTSRLRVDIDVPPAAASAVIPPLVLQPLVENAVKHGIAPQPAGGAVGIAARVSDGRLLVEVSDSGNGIDAAKAMTGHGLDLTRRRLAGVYGDDFKLVFSRVKDRFVVLLDLPLVHA